MTTDETITEAQLIDNLKHNAVSKLQITENASKNFELSANLTWKSGSFKVVTTRGNVREWASLDRMARHIRGYEGPMLPVELVLSASS